MILNYSKKIRHRKIPEAEAGKVMSDHLAVDPGAATALGAGKRRLRLLDETLEGHFIVNRHFRQGLTVQLDSGFGQTGDKSAVGHSVGAAGGVDADNPQFAEFPLLCATVAVCEYASAVISLLGVAVKPTGVTEVSLCAAQCALTALAGSCVILCFRHVYSFCVVMAAGSPNESPGRAAFDLEFVRATDLDHASYSVGATAVLAHATLLLNCLVSQEVALTRGAAKHFSGAGYLELLGNGFACFDHGKREERNGPETPCKAKSLLKCE